jgi:hypothetical protein
MIVKQQNNGILLLGNGRFGRKKRPRSSLVTINKWKKMSRIRVTKYIIGKMVVSLPKFKP